MAEYTPMMKEYLKTKEEYKDCILFYRLGDFYELFFDDAKIGAKELDLTLTGKSCGMDERAPMCGVPHHAVDSYLTKLVQKGYKVAVCEQLEDPKLAKGIVKRGVIRVVTPGTNTDLNALDAGKNNYICCVYDDSGMYGLAFSDISTGDFSVTEVDSEPKLKDELGKYNPSEIICNEAFLIDPAVNKDQFIDHNVVPEKLDSPYFADSATKDVLLDHFHVYSLEALGLLDFKNGTTAAGALLTYLLETQKNDLPNITTVRPYVNGNFCLIDSATFRNLEIVETMREKEKRGSLIWVLDKTKTAMGARALRQMLERPLIDKNEIIRRLDAVDEFVRNMMSREELREYLNPVYDLERLMMRISYRTATPIDLISFKNSIGVIGAIKTVLSDFHTDLIKELNEQTDPLRDLYELLDVSINDEETPASVHDGDIIKTGFNEEVDRLRRAKTDGKQWLADMEAKERERTGIKNLRIRYNKVFGYYIEVTNSYLNLVPDNYIRKQTLTNGERFYTTELKELENTILGAEDRLNSLENELYRQILDQLEQEVTRIQSTAKSIAMIDVLASLAYVAEKNHYVRPMINTEGRISIKDGRHPVVEQMISSGSFVANDTRLDNDDNRVAIITGPNMAGKSTYMRQSALIVLMAQIGSFVPADSADIGIVDRIFTRVGASDDLASGQSTFMVEMNEVANILKNATRNSLIILDEIGRGTSTFDGLSIAWAVVEHIADKTKIGAKTLFATHYHELTELEGKLSGVHNYCIAVKEQGEDIVFLRKIIPGGADRSYGIEVARLAGVPQSVIDRAREISAQLDDNDISDVVKGISAQGESAETEAIDSKESKQEPPFTAESVSGSASESESVSGSASGSSSGRKTRHKKPDDVDLGQISMFDTQTDDDIIDQIRNLDIMHLSPIDALNTLYELQSKAKNRWKG